MPSDDTAVESQAGFCSEKMGITDLGTGFTTARLQSAYTSAGPPFTQLQFRQRYQFVQPSQKSMGESTASWFREKCRVNSSCAAGTVTSLLPILNWLPRYNCRENLFGDIIAGVTTAILQIPQGMAYAMLARIPPIHGIYMAFFQCLIYVLLGTSRHVSVGSFAVVCIMTGRVVSEHAEHPVLSADGNASSSHPPLYDPVAVASTVTLAVGMIELAMFFMRMGALSVVLSDMLVKGFTTGAAVHVLMSQVKSLFGLEIPRYSGPGKLVRTLVAIVSNILGSNPAAMVISATAICALTINNELIKPKIAKMTRFPVPIELFVVIVGTLASYFGNLNDKYDVKVIGTISTGIPAPKTPIISLIPDILVDALIIAIVGYSVALSLAKLFSKKHQYPVDANQELVAYGVGNVFSSFFACAPMSASLSRSLILEGVGGKTQANGLVTSGLLLIVLLWLGPVFETLPNCVLSSIIVVSLKGMFMQFADLKQVWKTSHADAFIWFSSFLTVVLVDIDYGLAAGVIVSLVVLLLRSQTPYTALLGNVPGTDLYLDISKYHAAHEDMDIKIFHFGGPLHFCNRDFFCDEVVRLTGLNPLEYKASLTKSESRAKVQAAKGEKARRKKNKNELKVSVECANGRDLTQRGEYYTSIDPDALSQTKTNIAGMTNEGFEPDTRSTTMESLSLSDDDSWSQEDGAELQHLMGASRLARSDTGNSADNMDDVALHLMFSSLILDVSSVGFVDTASTRSLLSLIRDYEAIHVSCYLVGCRDSVLQMIQSTGCSLPDNRFFSTVHDAVAAIHSAVRCRSPDDQQQPHPPPATSCQPSAAGS